MVKIAYHHYFFHRLLCMCFARKTAPSMITVNFNLKIKIPKKQLLAIIVELLKLNNETIFDKYVNITKHKRCFVK